MAITSFIDPFGSMVQGYKEGQQTELQRQAGQRAMRDSDYEYGQRQIRDPLANRLLSTNVDQALFNYLTSQQQNPIQTKMMQEQLSGLGRQAEFERATQPARIEAANLAPNELQAAINARMAQANAANAGASMTNAQRAGVEYDLNYRRFMMDPIMNNPNVFNQTLRNAGQLDAADMLTDQYFPKTDLSSQYAEVFDEMTAKDPISFANLPRDQQEEAVIREVMRRNPGVKNFNIVPPGQQATPDSMISTPTAAQQGASQGRASAKDLSGISLGGQ